MMREYFAFLDELRESGETNMFGAPSYLRSTFGLTKREATDATYAWMKTFGDGTGGQRVALAEAASRGNDWNRAWAQPASASGRIATASPTEK